MPQSRQELLEKLNSAKYDEGGNVTYTHENGVKQRNPINKAVFYNEKKRERSLDEVLSIFHDTMCDLNAVSFEL